LKHVSKDAYFVSFTYQKPSLASSSEKTFALVNFRSIYSSVGSGKWERFMALLRLDGSMHNRMSPFGFVTTTILDTQSVGSLTFVNIFLSSKSSSFIFTFGYKENATFLGACTTGTTFSSIFISYSSPIYPSPSKTWEKSSILTWNVLFYL